MRVLHSFKIIHWLLSGAILFAAIGGPDHLHLCLDGQEAAVALHGPDGEFHHRDAASNHQDEDIDLPQTGLAKSFSKSFVQPAILLAVVFLLFSPSTGSPRPARFFAVPPDLLARHLLPPLRGPPAHNLR